MLMSKVDVAGGRRARNMNRVDCGVAGCREGFLSRVLRLKNVTVFGAPYEYGAAAWRSSRCCSVGVVEWGVAEPTREERTGGARAAINGARFRSCPVEVFENAIRTLCRCQRFT